MPRRMSATVHFSIKYDGPALASHQMDVRELAPHRVYCQLTSAVYWP